MPKVPCKSCGYCERTGPESGVCRRAKPAAIPVPNRLQNSVELVAVWPKVNLASDYCGEGFDVDQGDGNES